MADKITFSFGENWSEYKKKASPEQFDASLEDLETWLGTENIKGKRILDIGCGSGVHSYNFYRLGAKELTSFDYDIHSVNTTREFWKEAKEPSNWTVFQGSVLDENLMAGLGKYDIVYSWGVLHHTGSMWQAIYNSIQTVAPGGLFWIAIYQGVDTYEYDLELKKRYNNASWLGKKAMVWYRVLRKIKTQLSRRENPFAWNKKNERGMDVYHDIIDWLGGLPYEVASVAQIRAFCEPEGLQLLKVDTTEGCAVYLFKKTD